MEIKVLGPGCAKCEKTLEAVKQAVADTGVAADVKKVTNILEITEYGVMMTPAVVVDGEVKCTGKVPSVDDIKGWIGG